MKVFANHQKKVWDVSFSPDGKLFLCASQDGTVKLWSRNGKLVKAFDNYGDWVKEATFSPDGQSFATVSGQEIKLWSRDGQKWYLSETFANHTNTARSVNFSPDGQTMISGSSDNTIR